MPAILTANSFSVSHSFPLLVLFSWKPLADFSFQGALWRANLQSIFLQCFQAFAFSNLAFAALPFCHFSEVSQILPCQVKGFPNYFLLWFIFLGSPRYQPFVCMLLLSKLSGFLLHRWAFEKDIYVLRFLCFFYSLFELSQSHFGCAAHPRDPRPLAVSGIPAQFFLLNSFGPLNLAG